MRNIFYLLFSLIFISVSAQNTKLKINGLVTHGAYPLNNVDIVLKGTADGVSTDLNGAFSIEGNVGEVLIFSYLGMKTVEVILEEVTTLLNVKMVRQEVHLKEVVVKKNRRKKAIEREIEYDNNKDWIRTQFGIFDTRRSGLSIRIINDDELSKAAPTFLEAMRGKFIGDIRYKGTIFDEQEAKVYLRTNTSLLGGQQAAIYDVDGVILYEPPLFLAVQEIDRIGVIRGIGASGRYGRRGHGGVIVINTKRGKYKNPKLTQKFKDSIKRGRFKAKEAFATVDWSTIIPIKLENLYNAESEEKANWYYETYEEDLIESPYDAIDVGNYFMTEWQNEVKAEEIWHSVKKRYSNNAVILKALAYTYEENNDLASAMQLYQTIASLRPKYFQSYRDLANIYAAIGKHKKALNLYERHMLIREEGTQSGIDSIIKIESHNLLALDKIDLPPQVKGIEETLGFNPIRVVLEWNNGEAEFEMQCANPPNYYTWMHSFENNPNRIEEEKIHGYSSKQFYLNEELGGKWRFNLKYLGNKSFAPTYLKSTIYFDYGKPTQRKEVKVFRLLKENVNMHLLTIDLDSKSIAS